MDAGIFEAASRCTTQDQGRALPDGQHACHLRVALQARRSNLAAVDRGGWKEQDSKGGRQALAARKFLQPALSMTNMAGNG